MGRTRYAGICGQCGKMFGVAEAMKTVPDERRCHCREKPRSRKAGYTHKSFALAVPKRQAAAALAADQKNFGSNAPNRYDERGVPVWEGHDVRKRKRAYCKAYGLHDRDD